MSSADGRFGADARISLVTARPNEPRTVNEDNDEHRDRHHSEGLHSVEPTVNVRASAVSQARS